MDSLQTCGLLREKIPEQSDEYWRWPDMEELKYAFNPHLMLEVCIALFSGNRLHSFLDNNLCVARFFEEKIKYFGFSDEINLCMPNFVFFKLYLNILDKSSIEC